jgi:hypothetical protein
VWQYFPFCPYQNLTEFMMGRSVEEIATAQPSQVNARDQMGRTPLHMAVIACPIQFKISVSFRSVTLEPNHGTGIGRFCRLLEALKKQLRPYFDIAQIHPSRCEPRVPFAELPRSQKVELRPLADSTCWASAVRGWQNGAGSCDRERPFCCYQGPPNHSSCMDTAPPCHIVFMHRKS